MKHLEKKEWNYYLLYLDGLFVYGFYVVGAYSEEQMWTKAHHGEFHRDFRKIDRNISPVNRNVSITEFKKTVVDVYTFPKETIDWIWDFELKIPRP